MNKPSHAPPPQANRQLRAANDSADAERSARSAAEAAADALRSDLSGAQESLSTLERVYAQQLEALQSREASALGAVRVSHLWWMVGGW